MTDTINKIGLYHIIEQIAETRQFLVFRGQKESETVIIKQLKKKIPSAADAARIRQEYSVIKKLNVAGVIKSLGLIEDGENIAMVFEDTNGVSLKQVIYHNELNLKTKLKLCIRQAHILGQIHKANVIHKDIKPSNIIVSQSDSNEISVKMTDFGYSVLLDEKISAIYNPRVIEGSLPYMSPEQTGRMNLPVDYRTDLYSLGITLYELFTGRLPFISDDPMELIHWHIAKKPIAVNEIDFEVPEIISDIILKLLNKAPEKRYQNAFGLEYDLQQCIDQLEAHGKIEGFELGLKDISERFNIPQKIFGRDTELNKLMSLFENVCKGEKKLMFVAGEPGIGKSLLIHEVHKPIVASKGFFLSGKYDQLRRDVPYSSVIQAFQILTRQLLSEGKDRIRMWKEKILEALGTHGKVIIDFIPPLELIIGEQPEIPQLPPEAAQNRFITFFKKFLKIFACQDHPLTLFLDDLQWADIASLKLLENVLSDPELNYLFFIGAYRNNEVDATHPFTLMLNELGKNRVVVDKIKLTNLSRIYVEELVSHFLLIKDEKSKKLSELVFQKTRGNPFFVNQFMKSLYDDKTIFFDLKTGWNWDIEKILAMDITDNVVELMADKISRLNPKTLEIIKVCSCIGNRFELEVISAVMDKTMDEVLNDITEATVEGIVFCTVDTYRFLHDRVQEAAYSLISEEDRKELHYQIGKYFLLHTTSEALNAKIFFIVDQLNRAVDLLNAEERASLINLNVQASKKARASSAYDSAHKYISVSMNLIGENDQNWQTNYDTMLALYHDAIENAYLNAEYEQLEMYSQKMFQMAKDPIDRMKVHTTIVKSLAIQNKPEAAVSYSLKVMGEFGERFPQKPKIAHVLLSLIQTKIMCPNYKIESVIHKPDMTDKYKMVLIDIMNATLSAAYLSSPEVFALYVLKIMRLSIRYGIAQASSFAFSCYAMFINGQLFQFRAGYTSGQLGRKILDRFEDQSLRPKVNIAYYFFNYHWQHGIQSTIKPLFECYQEGLEYGDLEFGGYGIMCATAYQFLLGVDLIYLEKEVREYERKMKLLKTFSAYKIFIVYYVDILCLRGKTDDPCQLKADFLDLESQLPTLVKEKFLSLLAIIYMSKLILYCLFENHDAFISIHRECTKYCDGLVATYGHPVFVYHHSLCYLALCTQPKYKKQFLKYVRRNQSKLKKWVAICPMDAQHKYDLIEAEIAKIKGKDQKAIVLYQKAIRGAKENHFQNDEALATFRFAKFYHHKDQKENATVYFQKAVYLFSKWGAKAVADHIKNNYQSFLKGEKSSLKVDSSDSFSQEFGNVSLDLSTMIKASQVLSSEIDIEKLLKNIMHIAITNSGAERGFLLLEKNEELFIESECLDGHTITVLQSTPINKTDILSAAAANYSYRTGKYLVLDDAEEQGSFTDDRYIMINHVKSLICLPITQKGKKSGLLYLENNLTTSAFTQDRIELLNVLSVQAAISLENARLLREKEKAAELKREMEIAANIQTALLPKNPRINDLQITGFMKPSEDVGGDYYDVINSNNRDFIIIGDVSGHGIPSGLVMMMVQTAIRVVLSENPDISPAMLITSVNRAIYSNIQRISPNKYMTITIFEYLENGVFCYSGLHQDIMIYRSQKDEIEMLPSDGKWIGVEENLYTEEMNSLNLELHLEKDDVMLLYTDGIIEAMDKDKKMYEHKTLASVLKHCKDKQTDQIRDDILNSLSVFHMDDDITMVVVRQLS